MRRLLAVALVATSCAQVAAAQMRGSAQFSKYEVFGNYPEIESNDHVFDFGTDFNAVHRDFDNADRGFEGGVIRNFTRYFGVMGDVSADFSSGEFAHTVQALCGTPPCPTFTQNIGINPRLFHFLGGPELVLRNHTRWTPFGDALFGAAHATASFKADGPFIHVSRSEAETGFAMKFVGGVDVYIISRVSFRMNVSYGQNYVGSSALPPQRVKLVGSSIGFLFHFD
ncbi:MAG TPA: outer membrane beta-barrel protein [Candidatus Acidoferrales bacterium]|nr:outer membrane beta-barrel protein [Candidatus Acidoferrales bacterium]